MLRVTSAWVQPVKERNAALVNADCIITSGSRNPPHSLGVKLK